jgi:hypothetical protein
MTKLLITQQKCHANAKKKLKYDSLCIEVPQMWNVKCMIILVITNATGRVTKDLKKYLEATPRKHSTDSLTRTAILGTSHIIQKVQQSET